MGRPGSGRSTRPTATPTNARPGAALADPVVGIPPRQGSANCDQSTLLIQAEAGRGTLLNRKDAQSLTGSTIGSQLLPRRGFVGTQETETPQHGQTRCGASIASRYDH